MRKKFDKMPFKKQLFVLLGSLIGVYLILYVLKLVGVLNTYRQTVLITVCINIILAVSLNVISGFLGQLTLGHAGFMAIGAYTSALLTKNLALIPSVEFPLAMLAGGLMAMLFGFLICIPTLRLHGDYLAIITLAFGEIIKNVLLNLKITGGAIGLSAIPRYTNFGNAYFWMAVTVIFTVSLVHSKQGRAIVSIRENEIAAEAAGVNADKYKILAFVFGAFFAGIAGGLYAHNISIIQPTVFKMDKSIEILVMTVMGGMGNIFGSIIAAAVLTILPQALQFIANYRMLVYSIVLIASMLFKYAPVFQKFHHQKEEE